MGAINKEELLRDAGLIRNANTANFNSAERVGKMLVDIINSIDGSIIQEENSRDAAVNTLISELSRISSVVSSLDGLFVKEADGSGYRIKALFSLYSEGYISAGGIGSGSGGGGGASYLNDLLDVITTGAESGQVLKFNGENWVASTIITELPTLLTAISQLSGSGLIRLTNGTPSVDSSTYVKADGTSATGTWNINISGNAETAGSTTVLRRKGSQLNNPTSGGISFDSLIPAGTEGLFPHENYANAVINIDRFPYEPYYNYITQLGFSNQGMYLRIFNGSELDTTTPWNTIYHSGNLNKATLGLGNVDNTADINKNVASAQYAEYIKYRDTRNADPLPYSSDFKKGIEYALKANTTDSLNHGGNYHGVMTLHQWGDVSGGAAWQLGFTANGKIYARYGTETWSDWNNLAYVSDIPTIYPLTIQKNGTTVGTYTPDISSETINITDVASAATLDTLKNWIESMFEKDTTSISGQTLIKAKYPLYSVGQISAGGIGGDGQSSGGALSELSDVVLTGLQNGYILVYNSSTHKWVAEAKPQSSEGSVTSVGLQMPTGFSVQSSPITSSGTIQVSLASGYFIPTTSQQTNWNSAYTIASGLASWAKSASKPSYSFSEISGTIARSQLTTLLAALDALSGTGLLKLTNGNPSVDTNTYALADGSNASGTNWNISILGNAARATNATNATNDGSGNQITSNYGASLSAAEDALALLSKSGATLSAISGANIVTVLGNTAVNVAKALNANVTIWGRTFKSGGDTITGDLTLGGDLLSTSRIVFSHRLSASTSGNVLEVVRINNVDYLHSTLPFYSDGQVSAGGVGSSGSGSGSSISVVNDLNSTSTSNALSANMGRVLSSEIDRAYNELLSWLGDITNPVSGIGVSGVNDLSQAVDWLIDNKQATLVSGTNIKTINNQSILGSGNIVIESSGAPDLSNYVKKTGSTGESQTVSMQTNFQLAPIFSNGLVATGPIKNYQTNDLSLQAGSAVCSLDTNGKFHVPSALEIGSTSLTEADIVTNGSKTRSNLFTYSIIISCIVSKNLSLYVNIKRKGDSYALENGVATVSWTPTGSGSSLESTLVYWLKNRSSLVTANDDGVELEKAVKYNRDFGTWEIVLYTSAELEVLTVEESTHSADVNIDIRDITREGNKFYQGNSAITTSNGHKYLDTNDNTLYANASGNLIPMNSAYVYGYVVERKRHRVALTRTGSSNSSVSCTVTISHGGNSPYSKSYSGVDYTTLASSIVSDINSNATLAQKGIYAKVVGELVLDVFTVNTSNVVSISSLSYLSGDVTTKNEGIYSDASLNTALSRNERTLYIDRPTQHVYTWSPGSGFTLIASANDIYTKSEVDKKIAEAQSAGTAKNAYNLYNFFNIDASHGDVSLTSANCGFDFDTMMNDIFEDRAILTYMADGSAGVSYGGTIRPINNVQVGFTTIPYNQGNSVSFHTASTYHSAPVWKSVDVYFASGSWYKTNS